MSQNSPLEISNDGKTLIKCDERCSGEVIIPYGVTEIGLMAFCGCKNITSVVIPNSVTRVNSFAFSFCTSLTSIKIPKGVFDIDIWAFTKSGIKEIKVDEDNPYYCDIDGLLYSKDKSELLYVPNNSVEGHFIIPDCVNEIGERAFEDCKSLSSIELHDNISSIGRYAFRGFSSLTSIKLPCWLKAIGESAFEECTNLFWIVIPESVEIGEYAFRGCTHLRSIEIPNSVEKIGVDAFLDCMSLTVIHLGHPKPTDVLGDHLQLDTSKITLYVPIGSEDEYHHHPFYAKFIKIVGENINNWKRC